MAKILIGNIKGPQGQKGDPGATGENGKAATIKIGTVTTGAAGSAAKVVNSGTSNAAILDFTIPQGLKGNDITDVSSLGTSEITASADMYPEYSKGEYMRVVLGKIQKYLSDLKDDKAASFTISHASASWTSQTINNKTYYVYTQKVSNVYTETPDVMLAPSSGLIPTDAEESAYGQIVQATVDPEALVLKLYASSVPNADFVIAVKGVK